MEKNIQKVNVESLNLTEEKRRALKELFPQAFPDNILNLETLIDILELENEEEENILGEHYGLFWPGKKAARKNARTPSQGTLAPLKGRGIDEDKTKNIFIEGENLEVLKLLQKSYAGKIKLIYIDPPYNTGNDFIYKDKFSEGINEYYKKSKQVDEEGNLLTSNPKTSGRYHANWLSMMYPRLELAKNLLSDDGVIFVSIDDNEVHNLRHLMDEIFGQDCFKNCIIVKRGIKNVQAQFETVDKITVGHEYVMFFSKSASQRFKKLEIELDEAKNGSWNNHWRGTDRPSMRYSIFNIKPKEGQWRWGESRSLLAIQTYKRMLKEISKNDENATQEEIDKWYKEEVLKSGEEKDLLRLSSTGKPEHYIPPTETKLGSDLWIDLSSRGSNDLKNINSDIIFDNPKPMSVIQRIINFITDENDIILDFFAGSGTTGHSVFQQSFDDSILRNWILVQLPENIEDSSKDIKFVSEITYKRLYSSSIELRKKNNEKKRIDLGFKCFTLKETNFKTFSSKPLSNITDLEKLFEEAQDILKDGWKKEEVLWEILLQEGFPLHSKVIEENKISKNLFYRVSSDWCAHDLLICLDEKIDIKTEQDLLNLKKHETEKYFILIIRDCALFRNDKIKINLAENFKIRSL